MNLTLIGSNRSGRIVIAGRITEEFSAQLEAGVVDAMRRYPRLTVDLSGVAEIDHFGVRFLKLMQNLGGKELAIVATSPAVEQATDANAAHHARRLH
ncbi:MAG TPA: STAS domain-containing protein [Azonexus sp.]